MSSLGARAALLERLAALDPELFDPVVLSRIASADDPTFDSMRPSLELALDHDPPTAAMILTFLDGRLWPRLSVLGETCHDLVVHFVSAALTESEIDGVVEALGSTPERRARTLARLPVPNLGLKSAHDALRSAWRGAPPAAQHGGPIHRGEPTPILNHRGTLELCVFVAGRIEPLAPGGDPPLAVVLERARVALSGLDVRVDVPLADDDGTSRAAIARACAVAAHVFLRAPYGITNDRSHWPHAPIAPLLGRAAVELLVAGASVLAVARFLRELDEELCRLDVVRRLGRQAPSSPVVRAIFRNEMLALARLADGRFGLAMKQHRTTWTEGERDDILPMVPDAFFEAAVLAATADGT